jgi:hypothetical protein
MTDEVEIARQEGFVDGQKYVRNIEDIETLTKYLIDAQKRYLSRRFLNGGVDMDDLDISLELQGEAQRDYLAGSRLIESAYAENPERMKKEKTELDRVMGLFDEQHMKLVELTLPEPSKERKK